MSLHVICSVPSIPHVSGLSFEWRELGCSMLGGSGTDDLELAVTLLLQIVSQSFGSNHPAY